MVTGAATAAEQVAVTWPDGDAERCTDGSLALQFEFTSAAVAIPTQPLLFLNWKVALKSCELAGGAAE